MIEPIESYRVRIPDDARVKFDDAVRTAFFADDGAAKCRGGDGLSPPASSEQ